MVICILSFGPSLLFSPHEFVFDDAAAIVRNDDVSNVSQSSVFSNMQSIIVHDFWGQSLSDERSHKSYRPIVSFMFHLEYRFLNRTHLASTMKQINLMLHIAICCIIYEVLRRIFHDCHHNAISTATLLFAAHPIHTEVICSVVGRSDLLCALFFFLTIAQYVDVVKGLDNNEFRFRTKAHELIYSY